MLIPAYRLTKSKYAATAFDGESARRFGGRWNSIGTAIVYTAESRSLAAVELMVHLEAPARGFVIIGCTFDEQLIEVLPEPLIDGWDDPQAPTLLATVGDDWVKRNSSAVLRVPSVTIKGEFNYLLNPRHPDFNQISIDQPRPFPFDQRIIDLVEKSR